MGKSGEIPMDKSGEIPMGKSGEIPVGKSGEIPVGKLWTTPRAGCIVVIFNVADDSAVWRSTAQYGAV